MRENLRAARKAAGMTQQEVADRLGITLRYYQRIEYGESGGSFEIWDALEDLLGAHQRILRVILDIRPALKESLSEYSGNPQVLQDEHSQDRHVRSHISDTSAGKPL